MKPIYYIILVAVLIALLVVLWRIIKQQKHDNKVIKEYNKEMDNIRKSRIFNKEIKRRKKIETTKNFYTTYNEREDYPTTKRNTHKKNSK